MYYPFVRKALFQLDPERAHEFTFQQLRRITGTPLALWCVRMCRKNLCSAWG
jgi:dihydroorotate dehydrogenase